jgi:hypothetical protein
MPRFVPLLCYLKCSLMLREVFVKRNPHRGERVNSVRQPIDVVDQHELAEGFRPFASAAQTLELLREMIVLVAHWAEERSLYLVVESTYAGRTILEDRPANVQVISRLRWDAALYAPPPPRRPGQKGRPRRRGDRLPALQQLSARRRRWTVLPLVLYGRAVTPRIFTFTALWYGALRTQPVCIVVVRDPSRRRRDEAFLCTDLQQDPAFVCAPDLCGALDPGGHLPRQQAAPRLWSGPESGQSCRAAHRSLGWTGL